MANGLKQPKGLEKFKRRQDNHHERALKTDIVKLANDICKKKKKGEVIPGIKFILAEWMCFDSLVFKFNIFKNFQSLIYYSGGKQKMIHF